MNFRSWIYSEAKLDPDVLRRRRDLEEFDDFTLENEIFLRLDSSGNVVRADDWSERSVHLDFRWRSIVLREMSPESREFREIMKAVRKYIDIDDWEVSSDTVFSAHNRNRTVRYWLSLPEIRLANRLPKYLYHGTSTNLWYDSIKGRGLMPRSITGSSGSYGSNSLDFLSQGNLVYLSTHPDFAVRHASDNSVEKHGGKELILRISTLGLDPDRFVADEDSGMDTAQGSVNRMGTLAYRGRIPSENIEPFLISTEKTKGNAPLKSWHQVKDYKIWKRFHEVPLDEHPLTVSLQQGKVPMDSAEYFALKDAGLIGRSIYGKLYIIDQDSITDAQVRSILKNSAWALNAWMIDTDLRKHHRRLSDIVDQKIVSKEILKNPLIQILIDSGFVKSYEDEREVYLVHNSDLTDEDRAIRLAKKLGNRSFSSFAEDLKKLLGN